ncbi:MAG TPA: PPOX class F420-dependent oxidoreductase [Gaiellaceae bacterium]|jgi:PPOX class probable F420-dependent enzyme|nr:PPOX class F420-dependent oxidoreductase [Gaiellaceae bacterium]
MAQLTEEQRRFIAENPYVATATTLRPDGSPHNTIVWVDAQDGVVTFNTAVGRAKERYLRRDPRAAVLVVHPEDPYQWVAVSGRAELTTEGADEQIDHLAKKYLDQDEYPWRDPAQQRISVKIAPERVDSYGFDE